MAALISDLARVTAEDFRRAHPELPPALANDLAVDEPDVTEPLRLEAQHREKEALYLADVIAVRQGRP